MSTLQEIKQRVCAAIDAHSDEIKAIGEDIRLHPELGFKEFRTAAIVDEHFSKLDIAHMRAGIAVTGVKGVLQGRPVGGDGGLYGRARFGAWCAITPTPTPRLARRTRVAIMPR